MWSGHPGLPAGVRPGTDHGCVPGAAHPVVPLFARRSFVDRVGVTGCVIRDRMWRVSGWPVPAWLRRTAYGRSFTVAAARVCVLG